MLGFGLGLSHAALYGGSALSLEAQVAAIGVDALYMPGDPTSLYTARTGGANAVVNGVVGMILDKSQMAGQTAAAYIAGLTDIVTNGTFDTDLSGWTLTINGQTVEWQSGKVHIVSDGTFTSIAQSPFTVNAWYEVKVDVVITSGSANFQVGAGATYDILLVEGANTFIIKADGTDLTFKRGGVSEFTLDNITVKQIPGNHLVAPSDAARAPLRNSGALYWLEPDGVDDWYPTSPLLDLGEQWWHVGGWRSDIDGRRAFSTSTAWQSSVLHQNTPPDEWVWRNSVNVFETIVVGAPNAAHVLTIEQLSTNSLSGRFNGTSGSAITPYDDSLATQGLALFSQINLASESGIQGRMFGVAFSTGTITSAERAIAEAWAAEQSGVTL